jgi:peptidoglycan/LPS O-acetylase OafA/YrhL
MNTAPRGRLHELDVLRGLAALCVVVSHYTSYSARYLSGAPFGVLVPTIYGFYAVLLFFMISGFVIYFTLERSRTWQDFAVSRVSRLYPAYWTALTLPRAPAGGGRALLIAPARARSRPASARGGACYPVRGNAEAP